MKSQGAVVAQLEEEKRVQGDRLAQLQDDNNKLKKEYDTQQQQALQIVQGYHWQEQRVTELGQEILKAVGAYCAAGTAEEKLGIFKALHAKALDILEVSASSDSDSDSNSDYDDNYDVKINHLGLHFLYYFVTDFDCSDFGYKYFVYSIAVIRHCYFVGLIYYSIEILDRHPYFQNYYSIHYLD